MLHNSNQRTILALCVLVLVIAGAGYWHMRSSTGSANPLSPFLDTNDRIDSDVFADNIGSASVSVNSTTFAPATVSIKKGWQVVWTNKDTIPHRIAADPYPAVEGQNLFDSEAIGPGESFSFTFNQTGTYGFHDPAKPLEMRGTIIVE